MVEGTNFSLEQAVRVYLFSKIKDEKGKPIKIPGLADTSRNKLIEAVLANTDLRRYADELSILTQTKDGYIQPGKYWITETIQQDLQSLTNKEGRAKFLVDWKNNVDQIFSE